MGATRGLNLPPTRRWDTRRAVALGVAPGAGPSAAERVRDGPRAPRP